ncbi:MAG: sigma 54-interacting transcriptional regulator [Syntrophales bacterium]|jgi:PAS domain S-box-containing protein|nr:sigma 54-interacting transcriptional regulator [Syntrophales bacterium]
MAYDYNLKKMTTPSNSSVPEAEKFEAAMPDVEGRQQAVLQNIEEGYIEVDLKGRLVFWNDSFRDIIGYPEEELLGLDFRKYMEEGMATVVYDAYNKTFRTGMPNKSFTYEINRKDGISRNIENSISLIKDSQGRPVGFRSVVRDITERKRTEEDLEKHRNLMQAIFGSVKDAIITVDKDGVAIEANDATNNICGIERKTIIGERFSECLTDCNKSCLELFNQPFRKDANVKEYRIECEHAKKPLQIVVATSLPLLGRKGEFNGTVLVIRDITHLSNLERELRERHQFQNIIGKSKKMQNIYELLEDLANLETNVLITGESGTGKSLAAKAIHYSGNRVLKPVVTVNCSALPETLLESELFGHVKGAFTGAIKDSQGRFLSAQGGTIILDEIGDVSPRIQLKLLRILEEKEFERVGESIPIKVDVRVIACTNANLKEKIRLGEFREDLYYRLKVVEVPMPPLRERLDDIPLLVGSFCNLFNKRFHKNVEGVSDRVFKAFMSYPWPGNVRELEHSLESAFVICRGPLIVIENIPPEITAYLTGKMSILKKESKEGPGAIIEALHKTDWNKAKAARLLRMDRSTLYRKIKMHHISKPENV